MKAPSVSDADSLADSTYSIIDSLDGESQDGHPPNSLSGSIDAYPRADDVHSLSGNDQADESHDSGSDDEHADHHHFTRSDSIRYTEEMLGCPSTQSPSPSEYDHVVDAAAATPMSQSIEFREADSREWNDKISVKHTIRELDEEETAVVAEQMHIRDPPRRMVATIRQTMSPLCLSIREPLRILYVGSAAGRNEILYKISSAILASAPADRTDEGQGLDHDGVFNIVPLSSFGSEKVPETDEIQLMGVSRYYIKVDTCTSAEASDAVDGDGSVGESVYSLTLDNDKTYTSAMSPDHPIVSPRWALPHIAVFYLSSNDDEKTEKTRDTAWEFMTRHAIPSIFIAHAQAFQKPSSGRWREFVDQAGVHLSLESRDPEHTMPPERLPIDLTSFLNIDARQMNRNLAYLTGLNKVAVPSGAEIKTDEPKSAGPACNGWFPSEVVVMGQPISWNTLKRLVLTILMLTLWGWVARYPKSGLLGAQNAAVSTVAPASLATISAETHVCAVPTVTPTVTINLTSTKTIKLVEEPTHKIAAHFAGFLSDKAQSAAPEAEVKKTACSIEIYSSNEILVKVPAGTKTSWLARGAIDIDVWRGKELVKSKLSTTDEGILIEISKKDAYGVMNVSVVTTRRPKINETVAVNFGKPAVVEALEAGSNLVMEAAKKIAHVADDAAKAAMAVRAGALSGQLRDARRAAQDYSRRVTEDVVSRAKDSLDTDRVHKTVRKAQEEVARRLKSTEQFRDEVGLSVLRAQIASRLWWLKVRGRGAEYQRYQEKAVEYLKEQSCALEEKRTGVARAGTGRRGSACKTDRKRGKGKWQIMG